MKLNTQQLAEFERKLTATLASLNAEIAAAEKIPDFGNDVESTEDLPEEADEAEEMSGNAGVAAALRTRREAVELALTNMKSGTYGGCQSCGKDISLEVLSVDPESRYCKACKETTH